MHRNFACVVELQLAIFCQLNKNSGKAKGQNGNGYSTWDPRKNKGEVPQYDEIPYGDVGPGGQGPSGKGQLPDVPADYSTVPQVPARQGILQTSPIKSEVNVAKNNAILSRLD